MRIAIGSDHAGFLAKEEVVKFLKQEGYEVEDVGTYSKDSCDYPIFGRKVGELVASKNCEFGVVICSSGEGIMMAANKVKGIRCGIAYNDQTAELLRQHNDANVISFGANFMDIDDIKRRLIIFLNTDFLGERHLRRVNLIEEK